MPGCTGCWFECCCRVCYATCFHAALYYRPAWACLMCVSFMFNVVVNDVWWYCQWCLMLWCLCQWRLILLLSVLRCLMLLSLLFDVAASDVWCCCQWCCRVYHAVCWGVPGVLSALPFIGDHYGPAGAWWSVVFLSGHLVVESWKEGYQNLLLSPPPPPPTPPAPPVWSFCCGNWKEGYQNLLLFPCLVLWWKLEGGISKPAIVPLSGPVVETGRRDIKTCYCPLVWSCGGNWKEGYQNLLLSPCLVLWWKLEGGISKPVIVPLSGPVVETGRRDIKTCYCPLVWSCGGNWKEGYQNLLLSPCLVLWWKLEGGISKPVIVPLSGPVVETGRRDIKTCYCPLVWSCGGNWKEGYQNLLLSPCLVLWWKLAGGISKPAIVRLSGPFVVETGRRDIKTCYSPLVWSSSCGKLEGGISKHLFFLPLTFAPLCEDLLPFWWCLHSVRQWLPLHFINCLTSSGLFLFLLLSTCPLC